MNEREDRRRAPTSIDVAKAAGVSQSAVSRTFTPGASVSAKTRERVMAAAAALGYRPNLIPRIMKKDRSGIVAIVQGGLYNPFHAATLDAFAGALRASGRQVMLVPVESDLLLDDAVGELFGYRVDAVVTALSISSTEAADRLASFHIPIVTLNSGVTNDWIWSISSDNDAAGFEAARLLADRGGKRFAYIGGPPQSLAQIQREAGLRRGLHVVGIGEYLAEHGDYTHGGGYEAACRLFDRQERPDALFCVNDLTAFGALDALRHRFGLAVPADVLVVGYDNVPMASWPSFDLTSFDQNVEEMTRLVMAAITDRRPNNQAPIPPLLVERGSTRR